MPKLQHIPYREGGHRNLHVLLVGTLVFGRLEEVDGHYVYRPKSSAFQTRVFHDFNEAAQALLEYSHER